jgi:hypothetical protein
MPGGQTKRRVRSRRLGRRERARVKRGSETNKVERRIRTRGMKTLLFC